MTRDITSPIESAASVPPAGAVLRGVVMSRDARALGRPQGVASLARPADKPSGAPARDGFAASATASVPAEVPAQAAGPSLAYQEHGRAFQAGYDEGSHQGHAEGFKAGHAEGHEAGVQAGLEQGRESARQQADASDAAAREALQERLKRLDALLASLPGQLDARLAGAQDDMLALCFEAVVRIMGDAAASEQGVRAMVRQAVAEAGSSDALTLHVNPRDLAFLQEDEEIARHLGANRRVQWLGDERVALGGCLVATAHGSLDARLETQLARLAAVFSDARHEGGPA